MTRERGNEGGITEEEGREEGEEEEEEEGTGVLRGRVCEPSADDDDARDARRKARNKNSLEVQAFDMANKRMGPANGGLAAGRDAWVGGWVGGGGVSTGLQPPQLCVQYAGRAACQPSAGRMLQNAPRDGQKAGAGRDTSAGHPNSRRPEGASGSRRAPRAPGERRQDSRHLTPSSRRKAEEHASRMLQPRRREVCKAQRRGAAERVKRRGEETISPAPDPR